MDAFHVLSLKINNEGLTQAPKKENREDTSGILGNNHTGSDQETKTGIMIALLGLPTKFKILSASNLARVQTHHDSLELLWALFFSPRSWL